MKIMIERETLERGIEAMKDGRIYSREADDLRDAIREALAAQPAEPVAIVVAATYEDGSHAGHRLEWSGRNEANDFPEGTAFYAAPPAPAAVPLTEELVLQAIHSLGVEGHGRVALTYESGTYDIDKPTTVAIRFARAIECAHGIGDKP
jgi:hypothetical protein